MDDCDDYLLTPLAEDEDAAPAPIELDEDEDDDVNDDNGKLTMAEDYVQSLVTIESNWANGTVLNKKL